MVTEDILELAVNAKDLDECRNGVLDLVQRTVGFDLANVISTNLAGDVVCVHRGFDSSSFVADIHGYMDEFTDEELRMMLAPTCCVESDWMTPARRDQLRLHRELLGPLGVRGGAGHMWRNRYGVFGFYLARAGKGECFSRRDREQLNQLRLPIQLSEASFARGSFSARSSSSGFAAWAASNSLTRAEQTISELVIRGLRNAEIAQLVGLSTNTVRNTLAVVFRKVGISTRSELVFSATQDMNLQPATTHLRDQRWLRNCE